MRPTESSSWWTRNWKWIVPTGCLALIAAWTAIAVLILAAFFGGMRATTAYKEAVARAVSDPAVLRALGEPVRTGWFVSGRLSFEGQVGEAKLTIPLRGSRTRGTLYVVAIKRGGYWEFQTLELAVKGRQTRIDLISPGNEGMRVAWPGDGHIKARIMDPQASIERFGGSRKG